MVDNQIERVVETLGRKWIEDLRRGQKFLSAARILRAKHRSACPHGLVHDQPPHIFERWEYEGVGGTIDFVEHWLRLIGNDLNMRNPIFLGQSPQAIQLRSLAYDRQRERDAAACEPSA